MRLLLVALLLSSAPAFAEKDCHIVVGKDDIFSRGRRVEVTPGKKVEDVIAVDADVVVKSGATVDDIVAMGGSVTIEPGATVKGSVIVAGGKLNADPKARIKGSRILLGADGKLELKGEEGDDLELSGRFGGKDIGKEIFSKMLEELRHCRITEDS